MEWIWIALGIICMTLTGKVLAQSKNKKQKMISDNVIKQPYWYYNVGIIGLISFNFIGLVFLIHQREVISWLIMVGISLPYIFIMAFERNWKVEFSGTDFVFTNMFGKKRMYLYSEITLKNTGRAIKVFYNRKQVFAVSLLLINATKFENAYKKSQKS